MPTRSSTSDDRWRTIEPLPSRYVAKAARIGRNFALIPVPGAGAVSPGRGRFRRSGGPRLSGAGLV
jgi:hypothetical protein